MRIKWFILLAFLTVFIGENCLGQDINTDELQSKIAQIEKSDGFKGARLSLSIREIDSDDQVFSHNPDMLMTPASILKLITSSAALHYLGSDYRFKTYIESDAELVNGTLKGNLYIRGTGDPTLGSTRNKETGALADTDSGLISRWTKIIQAAGIYKIDGGIYGDHGLLDSKPSSAKWLWEDVGNYYGSGIHGLSYNENLYHIRFNTSGAVGTKPEMLRITPNPIDLKVINELHLSEEGTGDNAYVYGGPYTDTHRIKGTLPVGQSEYTIKAALPDPSGYLSKIITRSIMKKGIMVSSPSSSCYESPENCCSVALRDNVIHIEESPELSQIVKLCHLKSINTYSEAMLKAIAVHNTGIGSSEAGIEALDAYLADLGIETNYMHLYDGSGLSRLNAISSSEFSHFLSRSYATSGSIYKLLRQRNRLSYKTGYMERVRSHAGYFTKGSKTYSYCLMINDYSSSASDARKAIDEILSLF